jgi:hypothetical protein
VFGIKKVPINMGPILNGYGPVGVSHLPKHAPVNSVYTLCDLEQVSLLALIGRYVNKFQASFFAFAGAVFTTQQ